jgi:hypothetical protein
MAVSANRSVDQTHDSLVIPYWGMLCGGEEVVLRREGRELGRERRLTRE